jgi:hypothetical protein
VTGVTYGKEGASGFPHVARHVATPALALLAILFALILSRFQFGIGHTTYDYMSQARWLLDGGGSDGINTSEPPGYMLVWALLLNLPHALLIGFVLSLLSQAATVCCIHALLARTVTEPVAWLGAFLVAINGALAGSASYVWVESLFTAMLAASWLSFELVLGRIRERRELWGIVPAAALAALSFYLRYAAAPLLAIMLGWAAFVAWRQRRLDLALYAGLVILLTAPLPLFNFLISGSLSGHPIGVAPELDFTTALIALVREIGSSLLFLVPPFQDAPLFNLTNADGGALRLPTLSALIGTGIVLMPLVTGIATRRGSLLRIGLAVLAYTLFYALVVSHTRIDRLSLRFIVPILPLAIAACVMAAPRLERRCALLLAGAAAGFGLVGMLHGLTPDRYGYGPETMAYVAHHFPRGSTLLTNAYGRQIDAMNPGYRLLPIPYDDPFNGGYSEAYGIVPWNKAELDRTIRESGARALVILLGPTRDDPYLDLGAYGDAVQRLVANPTARVTHLADGMVVTFPELLATSRRE